MAAADASTIAWLSRETRDKHRGRLNAQRIKFLCQVNEPNCEKKT
jgi:hypothetical protein